MTAAKACVKCGEIIPASDVQLAPDVDERCHDCVDYCDGPDCARGPRTRTEKESS